jgi:hypothetical protein
MKRLTLAVGLTLLAAIHTPAFAVGRLADVNVVDRTTGAKLPLYFHRGEYWVAGTPGNKYAIDIQNAYGERVLVVASVDGVNVVTGETASIDQGGYVYAAREHDQIIGWRKSNTDVAAFEFTASPNSYAERTGRPRDVGVIGVALFKEKSKPMPQIAPRPRYQSESRAEKKDSASNEQAPIAPPASPSPAQSSTAEKAPASASSRTPAPATQDSAERRALPPMASEPKLGTAHGEREYNYVGTTTFNRASQAPAEVIRIRYDSYANLLAMGVIQNPRAARHQPNPFPDGGRGFVPDPPQ